MVQKGRENRIVSIAASISAIFKLLINALFFIFVFLFVMAVFAPSEDLLGGNVAVVPVKGVITTTGDGIGFEEKGTDSATIVNWIKKADKSAGTKAILLEIDSPGGSPVATDEIARAVKEAEKPVVAVIRESGASGAFWIATAADYVFANRMSVTGSIGVSASRLEFSGLLKDYNVTYRRIVAGDYKDAGSRWKEMTPEEQQLFQQIINQVHREFIKAVAENRKLPIEQVQELADGFVLTGQQALEAGLVDALGNKDDAVKHIEKTLNITAELYEFKPERKFVQELLGLASYNMGKGIGTALTTRAGNDIVRVTT